MYNDKKEARGTLIAFAVFSLFFVGLGVSVINFERQEHQDQWMAHSEEIKHNQIK